jgi:hypothetical protein
MHRIGFPASLVSPFQNEPSLGIHRQTISIKDSMPLNARKEEAVTGRIRIQS